MAQGSNTSGDLLLATPSVNVPTANQAGSGHAGGHYNLYKYYNADISRTEEVYRLIRLDNRPCADSNASVAGGEMHRTADTAHDVDKRRASNTHSKHTALTHTGGATVATDSTSAELL